MGIKGLAQLLENNAPGCILRHEMNALFGRKIAIDASMSIYQFMIAVRSADRAAGAQGMGPAQMLTNEDGEVTSHLQGIFNRTIKMMENGIKPCYVFDGKAPTMKAEELAKRSERRGEAEQKLKQATEEANVEEMEKHSKRLVKVSPEHNAEVKKLLGLMGVPVVQAAGEAEAQCAALAKSGKVWATATEDMDALTFASPILLRHMTFSSSKKASAPITEFQLAKALEELDVTMDQFIDICILSGCDYLDTIRGVGSVTALKLVKKHGNLEGVLKNLDPKKYPVPSDYNFEAARKLFKAPDIVNPDEIQLEWKDPDEQGLIEFLVNQKGFNSDRVKSGIKKLKASKGKSTQKRLADFFGAASSSQPGAPAKKTKTLASSGGKTKAPGAKKK